MGQWLIDSSFPINPNGSQPIFGYQYSLANLPLVSTRNTYVEENTGSYTLIGDIYSYSGISTPRGIVRITSAGTIDNSFISTSGFTYSSPGLIGILSLPNSQYLVYGRFTSYSGISKNSLARLNYDGTLDTSFPNSISTFVGIPNIISIVKLLSNNKIFVGGDFSSYNGISRRNMLLLNYDGSLDTNFVPHNPTGSTTPFTPSSVVELSDGSLLVGGGASYSGSSYSGLIRITQTGSLVPNFNLGGTGVNQPNNRFEGVNDIEPSSDGNFIICGNFNSYNGVSNTKSIVKVNSGGTIVSTFNYIASGMTGHVRGVKEIQPDNFLIWGTIQDGVGSQVVLTGGTDVGAFGPFSSLYTYNYAFGNVVGTDAAQVKSPVAGILFGRTPILINKVKYFEQNGQRKYLFAGSFNTIYSGQTGFNNATQIGAQSIVQLIEPTSTPTPSITPTSTLTQTPTKTPTKTPSSTPTSTPTPTPTLTPSKTPTQTPTKTSTPTITQTSTQTPTNSVTPTPSLNPVVGFFKSCCDPNYEFRVSNVPFGFVPLSGFYYLQTTEGYNLCVESITGTTSTEAYTYSNLTPGYTDCSDCFISNPLCPTPTPTRTPTLTPTQSITPSFTPTYTPTPTNTQTETLTPTPSLTNSTTPTPSITTTPSVTNTSTQISPGVTPTSSLAPEVGFFRSCCDGNYEFRVSGIPSFYFPLSDYYFVVTNEGYNVCAQAITSTTSTEAYQYFNLNLFTGCTDCLDYNTCPTPTQTQTPTITPTITLTPSMTPTISLTPSFTPTSTTTGKTEIVEVDSIQSTCETDPLYDSMSNVMAIKLSGDPKNPKICVRVLKFTGDCITTGTCDNTGYTYSTGYTIQEYCSPTSIYPTCEQVNPAWLNLEHWFQINVVWERYTWMDDCDLLYRGGLDTITRKFYLESLAGNSQSLIGSQYTSVGATPPQQVELVELNSAWLDEKKYRKGRLKIYINGVIFFTIEDFEEIIPRGLNTDKEKQIGVPFNMSWGGGTQGLRENLTFSSCTLPNGPYIQDPECLPTSDLSGTTLSGLSTNILLEQYFAGTFEGGISQFRFYIEPLSASEVKHNFKLLKNTFRMFNPDCPDCTTQPCPTDDFTYIINPT